MNYLLDEQLHENVATALTAISTSRGDDFSHVYDFGAGGTDDDLLPGLCGDLGITCLISANVRDFGAKLELYRRLLDQGIHIVVLRPGKQRLFSEAQLSIIAGHLTTVACDPRDVIGADLGQDDA